MEPWTPQEDEDLPDILPGEIVHNENGDLSFKIISQIGVGRCCVVYKAVAVRDGTLVAVKCFRRGECYEGAVQRERFILERYAQSRAHIVTLYDTLEFRGYTFFVLELLQDNVRQIIYKNDRHGLSPWLVVKFARDVLTSLLSLHSDGLVHADLKPHNILWSGQDKVFKLIDFGLSFSVEESDLHQVQSLGYRAPESEQWDAFKQRERDRRKRRLGGTYQYINNIDTRNKNLQENFMSAIDATGVEQKHLNIICDTKVTEYTNEITQIHHSETHHHHINLQHSDSHSSGIFSQENSERSQISYQEESRNDEQSSKFAAFANIHNQSNDAMKENLLCNKLEASASCNSINLDDETVDKLSVADDEHDKVQDWRKTRGKSLAPASARPGSMQQPPRPGPAADLWSLGCLLTEVTTGRKLFQAGDKLASVLRPAQLLEMKLGDTEAEWAAQGHGELFNHVKDLIIRCVSEDPAERIEAAEAVSHPIFSCSLSPAPGDLSLLPTPTLQFSLLQPPPPRPDLVMQRILAECRTYGDILECRLGPGGHTLVCFTEVGSAVFARQCLTSAATLGQDSDTEDDMCDDIEEDSDDINTADIDGLKFRVTFYI